jgi:hypothetical protein
MSGREDMFGILFLALVFIIAAFAAGWLFLAWLLVKHPIVGLPIAAYIGFDVWLGANDAQALMCYALIALLMWRLVHKESFERLVGRWLRRSGRRPRAVPARREDPIGRIRTVG